MTDLPPLATKVPEAAQEYAKAMQAFRDGSLDASLRHLMRAVQLDPDFALAHLTIAAFPVQDIDERRKHLAAAVESRTQLGDRDKAILETVQSSLGRSRLDAEDDMRRWKALSERYPLDAWIVAVAGGFCLAAEHEETGAVLLDRALALDPKLALPHLLRAWFQQSHGDLQGSLASVERCLAVSPSATSCVAQRASIERALGQCARFEDDARRMVVAQPESEEAWETLAGALVSNGAPIESVDDALRHARDRATMPTWKALHEVLDPIDEARVAGDFASSIAAFPSLDAYSARQTVDNIAGWYSIVEIVTYAEVGRNDKAADVAEAYLKRRPALTMDDPADTRLFALWILHVTGRISEPDFRAKRESWARECVEWRAPSNGNDGWLHFYAGSSTTPADALEALEALPRYSPLPSYEGDPYQERVMGQVLFLAGRVDEAIPHLRRATNACFDKNNMWSHQRAAELLGEALEQTGDKAGACDAYAEVLKRWGHAKPRSVTADKARAHSKALGCASP